MKVLVTGGLGFIGSHIVDELVKEGYDVRVLDNLEPQVHSGKLPDYVNSKAEVIIGDVRDSTIWSRVLDGVDVVFHEAARVGLGQSQYEISSFVSANVGGTAGLLNFLANNKHSVRKLFVACSNTEYGEGLYKCAKCGLVEPSIRSKEQLDKLDWGLHCPKCGSKVLHVKTPESKSLQSINMYSLTKKYQEELCLSFGKAYGVSVVCTRYFNVYGPRQSLSNPYTGVAAIFISRFLNGNKPVVFEDGLQSRDFVHVEDVARANVFLLKSDASGVFNVGTGNPLSILDLARLLEKGLGVNVGVEVSSKGRVGDVRHCFADNSKLLSLGFQFKYPFIDVKTLLGWTKGQKPVDNFSKANNELKSRGLL